MDCTLLAEVKLRSYLTEAKKLVRRAAVLSTSGPEGDGYPSQQQRLDDEECFFSCYF